MTAVIRLLSFFITVSAVTACDATDASRIAASSASPVGGRTGDEPACGPYTTAFCEVTGNESLDCRAFKELVGVLPPSACAAGLADLGYTKARVAEERKLCGDVTERLCADLGPESEGCRTVRQRTPLVSPEQCRAMLQNYPKVLADFRTRARRTTTLPEQVQARLIDGAQAAFGSPDAKVHLVIFSDFQCPFSRKLAPTVDEIRERYGDRVYLVFRQFPLEFHAAAALAAEASLAAAAQQRFWPYHRALFAGQGKLGREHLETFAGELGLDLARFKQELDAHVYRSAVEHDLELGKSVRVVGTPTVFLDGERVLRASDESFLFDAIDRALGADSQH